MGFIELNSKYQRLRDELEAAYNAPAWNRSHIDRLADEIVATELALSSCSRHQPEKRPHAGELYFA